MHKRVSNDKVSRAVKYLKGYNGFNEICAIGIVLVRILDILEDIQRQGDRKDKND